MHTHMGRPYIRVWDIILSHMRTGYPIRVWDVPYAYGTIYAYGAEQLYYTIAIVVACALACSSILNSGMLTDNNYYYHLLPCNPTVIYLQNTSAVNVST